MPADPIPLAAAALREIAEGGCGFYEGLPEFVERLKRIAARALADGEKP